MIMSMICERSSQRLLSGRKKIERSNQQVLSSLVLFILAFIFLLPRSVHAYANYLKCYIEFDDNEEVIMNRPIVPSEDQPEDQKVYIEIQPYASQRTNRWMVSTQQEHQDLFPSSIYNTTTTKSVDSANTLTTLLKLRLKVSRSLKRKNVQFVVEATGEGVSFVGPGVMCDGSRAFSRRHNENVLLQINSTMATTKTATTFRNSLNSDDKHLKSLFGDIELVAGWATGYEAVKLTPKMIIRRSEMVTKYRSSDSSNVEQTDGERNDEL